MIAVTNQGETCDSSPDNLCICAMLPNYCIASHFVKKPNTLNSYRYIKSEFVTLLPVCQYFYFSRKSDDVTVKIQHFSDKKIVTFRIKNSSLFETTKSSLFYLKNVIFWIRKSSLFGSKNRHFSNQKSTIFEIKNSSLFE